MGVFSSSEAKVIKPISDLIWEWYGAGDTSRIKSVFELGNVLRLLALTPEQKVETIPDCPCCELIGQYSGTDTCFLALCADKVDVNLIQKLKDLSHTLQNLAPEETLCFSRSVFSLPGWLSAQELAGQILELLSWSDIQKYEEELS
ncbi:hypothetical protein [Pseudomonas viridiflava]|uniref:hypothetical protein n=1 Tax=Pseudomonas viridiflava TaxID=33069 RepID=UPI000F01910F|nr:hypothetical protein [Pseudomonas viridiflava]